MYEVAILSHFDSAHFLRGYRGRCENLHGHRYQVEVGVTATELDEIGLAFDFTELKRLVNDLIRRLDHVCLNDVEPFTEINPSAENIARTIFDIVDAQFKHERAALSYVTVWESPDSRATYRR